MYYFIICGIAKEKTHKLYFVQNTMTITSFTLNVQSKRPLILLHTGSYIPEGHNLYLVLVKMVTVLFMHDVTNQTITTYHLFIIYLFICASHKFYMHHCRHSEAGSLSGWHACLVCGISRNQISTRNRMTRQFFRAFTHGPQHIPGQHM
jgi:hypothetical protein